MKEEDSSTLKRSVWIRWLPWILSLAFVVWAVVATFDMSAFLLGSDDRLLIITQGDDVRGAIGSDRVLSSKVSVSVQTEYDFVQSFVLPNIRFLEIHKFDFRLLRHADFLSGVAVGCDTVVIKHCEGVSLEVALALLEGLKPGATIRIVGDTLLTDKDTSRLSSVVRDKGCTLEWGDIG